MLFNRVYGKCQIHIINNFWAMRNHGEFSHDDRTVSRIKKSGCVHEFRIGWIPVLVTISGD